MSSERTSKLIINSSTSIEEENHSSLQLQNNHIKEEKGDYSSDNNSELFDLPH